MGFQENLKDYLNLLNSNKFDECLDKIISDEKEDAGPLYENLKGVVLAKKNLVEDAKFQFRNTINKYPNFPDAYYNFGTLLYTENNFLEAENFLKKAINLKDRYYEAIFNLGNIYRQTDRIDLAIECYNQCKQINELDPDLLNVLGLCYQLKKNYKEAILFFNKALNLKNDSYQIYSNLGLIYLDINDLKSAFLFLKKSIEINPTFSEGLHNLGNFFRKVKNYDQAMYYYEKSKNLNNSSFKLFYNIARCQADLRSDFFSAIKNLKYSIFLKPDYLAAHALLGSYYIEIFDHKHALYHFEKCASKFLNRQDSLFFNSLRIFNMNYFIQYLKSEYFKIADNLNQSYDISTTPYINKNYFNKKKIKIGFFSGDFYRHAVGFQIIELINKLSSNDKFEIHAFYSGTKTDEYTSRFIKLFFKWNDVSTLNVTEIIKLARGEKLDIAFDLSGHTENNLLEVFHNRVAEKQITWCGYLNSTGIKNVDYILGDKSVFNEENKKMFSEKALKMPNCWTNLEINKQVLVNPQIPFEKNGYITFGCFNNIKKLNDQLLKNWVKILLAVNNSKLYLKSRNFENVAYCNFFYEKMEEFGLKRDKIIIEQNSKRNELLNSYNKIDIALDTFPYNGGTTTLEAYSMCVPVLTLVGENFISRCGYSINSNLGLNDWSCFTYEEYVEKGISFASNFELLKQVRKYLIENREKKSVFNSELFTEDFITTIESVLN